MLAAASPADNPAMPAPPASVQPIPLSRDADGHPYSPLFGDVYASRDGAAGQARHVFLAGNGLPEAWRGREQFVVLETGFGLGTNFLATWQAWRSDGARCRRLHFVSVEKHPLAAHDLLPAAPAELQPLARMLVQQWPLPIAGLHRLEFDGGAVSLTLALGDARDVVPQLVVGADAIYLDGFAPDRNPGLWEPGLLKAVARCARPGATLATWCTARAVRDALAAAGFELQLAPGFGRKRHMLVGRYAPRWRTRRHEPPDAYGGERSALIVGAGLAGSACAHALTRRGWQVQVVDEDGAQPAAASALPWGLLHPHLAVDDAPLARLMRAGVTATHAALARTLDAQGRFADGIVASVGGVLQLADDEPMLQRWQQAVRAQGLPPAFVQICDAGAAATRTGLQPRSGGLWWPQGALVSPRRWRAALLAGSALRAGTAHRVLGSASRAHWQVTGADGGELGSAPVLIVAAALSAPSLTGSAHGRVQPVRGRITQLRPDALQALSAPITGDGYLMRDPDGGAWVGATYETALPGGEDVPLTDEQATAGNLRRMEALLAAAPPAVALGTFDAVRCVAHDRLPLAGAVADEDAASADAPGLRGAHLEDLPRRSGLHASYALGSRGLALAPLMAELIAARIEGEPLPLPRDLAAVVDPARFLLQALRHGCRGDTRR